MDTTAQLLATANELYARADPSSDDKSSKDTRPPVYKAIGISLAIASGLFIGTSFVLKKTGLLRANVKYNEEAGEGYGYLKNAYWWSGMTLMIIGEICNFVAYAFVDAILVTPLGALSVVITTILSAIFLKERLSFVGKVGCFMCIIGSVVIVLNAPEQSSVATIQDMKHFVLAPGFLSYAGVVIAVCAFIALWAGPRYGKRSMLVYLSVCSLIGGLSVVATQGLGAAIVTQIGGTPQFNQWFLYLLLVFVIATLLTEIIYLNKALNIFNAALVTPTYYVYFTSSTIVTSSILFQGFKGSVVAKITVVMGFLQICSGVILLQLSKSAKDVPDTAVFTGDLDQVRTVAEQEEPESEPKADAIRGTAAIIRRISQSRQRNEAAEAKRIHEEKMRDQMEPIGEDEQIEWDGLRRRRTTIARSGDGNLQRRKTLHPPLGLTHFPDDDEEQPARPGSEEEHQGDFNGGFMRSFRRKAQSTFYPGQRKNLGAGTPDNRSPMHPVALTEISFPAYKGEDTPATAHFPPLGGDGAGDQPHVFGLPQGLAREQDLVDSPQPGRPLLLAANASDDSFKSKASTLTPPHTAKRQFSFQNPFHRHNKQTPTEEQQPSYRPSSRLGIRSRGGSKEQNIPGIKSATEEERLGLVKGDSSASMLQLPEYQSDDEDGWRGKRFTGISSTETSPVRGEKEIEAIESYRGSSHPALRRVDSDSEPRSPNRDLGLGGPSVLSKSSQGSDGRSGGRNAGAFI